MVTLKKKSSAQVESPPQSTASRQRTSVPEPSPDTVTDCAFTEQVDAAAMPVAPGHGETLRSGLIGRGKYLLAGEARAVGTAAAIVVGAALIEVECGFNNRHFCPVDRDGVAQRIARLVGIKRVYSEVLPQDKADIVRSLRAAAKGPFAMVGDGVNDSPALAQADVGIALVVIADIARAAADVVLMEEGLHLLLPAIDISRDALALVRQNYTLIAGANTLALALALPTGWMSPMACTLLSNGSALLATANAMRPLLASRTI